MCPSRHDTIRVPYSAMSCSCVIEQDRDAPLDVQPLKKPHDLDAGAGVEIAGRLVGQEDRWIRDQRARDGDALLLPARQLIGVVVGAVAQADRVEHIHRPLPPLGGFQLSAP